MKAQQVIQVKSREEIRDDVQFAALDTVVSLNSLYVVSSFLGFSLTTIGLHSIDGRLGCDANISTIRTLMFFEVISFAFFLTSSLVAHGLKIMIKLVNAAESNKEFRSHFNRKSIRKIRLGILSCRSLSTVQGAVALVVIVSCGVVFHVGITVLAEEKSWDAIGPKV
uniref:Uncharacterized protein n=1 Tax=Vitis vinifera TaxID=29760 RepID=F6HDZ6_VITVI